MTKHEMKEGVVKKKNKMKEIIRKMKVEDFETIMKIFDETDFGCVGIKEIYKPGRQEQMMIMREVLRKESLNERILVIENGDGVIGYAIIQETPNNWHIGEFAIDSSHRGQGIGRYFMEQLKEMAKKCKKNISLECYDKDNLFFLKQGFQKINEDEIETEYKWEYQRKIEEKKTEEKKPEETELEL